MTVATTTSPRRLSAAVSAAALTVLSLGPLSCADPVEPEMDFVEAMEAALDEAHEAHDDRGDDTLDDIEAAANRRIREEVRRGTITREEARRLSGHIARLKQRILGAVESGRLTLEEGCAIFRREIARLFRELREEKKRRGRG